MATIAFFFPLRSGKPLEAAPEVRGLGVAAGLSGFGEHPLQIGIALSRPPALVLACTLVVPRTERRPRGKMLLGGKGIHVDPYFGDDGFRDPHVYSQDFVKHFGLLLERDHVGGYFRAEARNRLVEEIDMGEDGPKEQAVVSRETPFQSLLQFGEFFPQSSPRKVGKDVRVRSAFEESLEHCLSGDAHDVRGDGGKLDVRCLQEFVEAVYLARPLADQRGTITGEISQVADLHGRDKTSFKEAVRKKVCDPLAVADIGLSSGYRLHMRRIDYEQGERTLKNGVDGLPEDAGALHGHMGHGTSAQPVVQDYEVPGRRAESLHLPLDGSVSVNHTDTGENSFLVDIETRTPHMNNLHRSLPTFIISRGCRTKEEFTQRAPSFIQGATIQGALNGIRVTLIIGLAAPNKADLSSWRHPYDITETIFMLQGALRGMDVN